jgi:hypothetical protein
VKEGGRGRNQVAFLEEKEVELNELDEHRIGL